jgi:hypothetical protein
MARSTIQIQQPLAGLDRNWAFQSQPPFSLPDANNVRCRDVFEQRSRLGSRPGLVKAFAQNVSTVEVESFGPYNLAPTKDTFIGGDISPIDANYGSEVFLYVGRQSVQQLPGNAPNRALFHFDLTVIPAGATITLANLVLTRNANSGTPAAKVYRVVQTAWTEGNSSFGSGANWAKYDGSTNWGTAGCSHDGNDYSSTTPAPVDWSIDANPTVTINVLAHATAAFAGTKQMHLLLKLANDLTSNIEYGLYHSLNYNTIPGNRPKLVYVYEV